MTEISFNLFSHSFLYEKGHKIASILVNSPLFDIRIIKRLWGISNLIYCADGASNRLYNSLSIEERSLYLPHSITGDLDSILPFVEEYYKSHNVEISRVYDQDNNDIDKCIESISKHELVVSETKDWTILLICPFGGRYDHEMAMFHSTFRWLQTFHRVILISNETIAHAIPTGKSELEFIGDGYGPYCGLAALAGDAIVSTEGLKWNLSDHLLKIGVLTSTSNELLPSSSNTSERSSRSSGSFQVLIPQTNYDQNPHFDLDQSDDEENNQSNQNNNNNNNNNNNQINNTNIVSTSNITLAERNNNINDNNNGTNNNNNQPIRNVIIETSSPIFWTCSINLLNMRVS